MRDDERCGRSKEVNTPELIGQRVRVKVNMLLERYNKCIAAGGDHFKGD